MGGEHSRYRINVDGKFGSSPRGRGTFFGVSICPDQNRFIPAWAGNIHHQILTELIKPVHPRVGGEHSCFGLMMGMIYGSSPRGRGTFAGSPRVALGIRFIPAWAGNMYQKFIDAGIVPVHPRVGGEHAADHIFSMTSTGSSPRGRGTYLYLRDDLVDLRFIPAWAGNIPGPRGFSTPRPVHPRVGGEHCSEIAFAVPCTGSSPRGRGT